jgi:DNA-binding IclR family transcriptional regulator
MSASIAARVVPIMRSPFLSCIQDRFLYTELEIRHHPAVKTSMTMPRKTSALRRPARGAAEVVELRPQSVPAVDKAIAIVRLLNARGAAGTSLSDVSASLSITRSHCYNILRTLAQAGWVLYEPGDRLYRLGPSLAAATAASDRLADALGLPCTVCEAIADGSFLVVHTAHYPDPSVYMAPVGYRFPPTAAAQFKARLAWLGPAQQAAALDAWKPVRHTRTTIVERGSMARDLAASRARGYAASRGEFVDGFVTLALPIFDRAGEVAMIVSCAARAEGFERREAQVARALAGCAQEIHVAIDGRPPVDFPRA